MNMIKFLIICIRLYMAGFRINRSDFVYPGFNLQTGKKDSAGLHRFYWDYGKTVKVLDMPDIDWFTGQDGKIHYNLMYNGHVTNIK